jgi:hypothetical protein
VECGKRLWTTKRHVCLAVRKIKFGLGGPRGKETALRDIVKDKYMCHTFVLPRDGPTVLVRLFMEALRPINNGQNQVKLVRNFPSRFSLSGAEVHAVLFHLGYRYQSQKGRVLDHMKINGYLDNRPRVVIDRAENGF